MAVAGGRIRRGSALSYYSASSDSDLRSALTEIRDQVGACTYLTSSVPGPGGSITLAAGDSQLFADQWTWGDRRNGEILLLGQACEAMTTDNPPQITATVECN